MYNIKIKLLFWGSKSQNGIPFRLPFDFWKACFVHHIFQTIFFPSNTLFTGTIVIVIVKASKEVIEKKKFRTFFPMVSKENYDCSSGDHLFSKILNVSFKAFKSETSMRKNQLNYQGMQCQMVLFLLIDHKGRGYREGMSALR